MEKKDNKYVEKEYYANSESNVRHIKKNGFLMTFGAAATSFIKGFFDSIQTLVIALVLFLIVYVWFLSPHQVSGTSMVPNYENGEILLADKFFSKMSPYKRGDVIIFKYDDQRDFIKRIIGLPGEKVMIKDGKVYINDKELNEPYLPAGTETHEEDSQNLAEGIGKVVPEGSFFVLGDNREFSSDSRAIGFINPKGHEIKGRVWLTYWPLNKIGIQSSVNY